MGLFARLVAIAPGATCDRPAAIAADAKLASLARAAGCAHGLA
ncbi:hypothetical protein [Limnothrix redekei]|uniref:Uncharacterized protein n=1 Tax=Limnothrix redekei LRLZ20PSL1 TaxID=3112953 RepID=A0ABW7C899_9CYAN